MNVNLFPVIYTDLRPDGTLDEGNIHTCEYFKQVGDKNWLNFLSSIISVNNYIGSEFIFIRTEKNTSTNMNGA